MRSLAPSPALLALLAALAPAQEELRWEGPVPATVRLGDASRIVLSIEGRGANPGAPELPKVEGLSIQASGPSRRMSSFFDGRRMVEHHQVQFEIVLQPQREGTFQIPPIRINTGSRLQQTEAFRIDAVKDLQGGEFGFLDVTVEPQRVYVHEPVHVFVEFGADAGLRPVTDVHNRYRFVDFEVQAPWLQKLAGAVPIEVPDPENGTPVVLNRTLQTAGYESGAQRNGRAWHRFWFQKAFLPTRTGRIELPAPLLRYHVMLREGRTGIFGERVGAQSQNYYVYGKPVVIDVLPIPEEGRPEPFYGGVGRFTLEASLDRSTVKLGASVKLTLTVRGRGNLEFLRLPELDALPGFHKLGQTEQRDQESRSVTYDLTPTDAAITEVPAIGWNFFDTTPGLEKFVEVQTRPLPLQVRPLANGETLAPLPEVAATAPVVPGVDDIHDLHELAGPPVPLPDPPGMPWRWAAVLGPWSGLLLLALLLRFHRRRAADPLARRARAAAATCRAALRSGGAPVDALCGYLADRLGVPPAAVIGPDLGERLRGAGCPPDLADEAAAAVERGVAGRYGGAGGLDAAAVAALVARLEPAPLRRLPAALLFLLLPFAAPAPVAAQDGVAAYRAGEHAGAAREFAAAVRTTGDARQWANLGNAHFRQGDLPRAIWAWESARLGLPRDAELVANLRLARRRLELADGGGEPFLQAVADLRSATTPDERLLLCIVLQGVAAALLLLGGRRRVLRGLGLVVLAPAVLLALEVLWWQPARPPQGIALRELPVVAEPRADLPPVATVRPGAALAVLGGDETWLRVRAGDRRGYVRAADLAVVGRLAP